jgi:hypothetical protein
MGGARMRIKMGARMCLLKKKYFLSGGKALFKLDFTERLQI